MWYTGWWKAGARETHDDMVEIDEEQLPWMEAGWQLILKKGASGDQVWDQLTGRGPNDADDAVKICL